MNEIRCPCGSISFYTIGPNEIITGLSGNGMWTRTEAALYHICKVCGAIRTQITIQQDALGIFDKGTVITRWISKEGMALRPWRKGDELPLL